MLVVEIPQGCNFVDNTFMNKKGEKVPLYTCEYVDGRTIYKVMASAPLEQAILYRCNIVEFVKMAQGFKLAKLWVSSQMPNN